MGILCGAAASIEHPSSYEDLLLASSYDGSCMTAATGRSPQAYPAYNKTDS